MGKGKCGACKTLAKAAGCSISICDCGLYHVRVQATTLHLTSDQFETAARLFKICLGISASSKVSEDPKNVSDLMPHLSESKLDSNRIICLQCGEAFDLIFDQTDCLKDDIARAYGFEMVQHKMEILGYCQWCRSTPL
jgi:hypothetical protein